MKLFLNCLQFEQIDCGSILNYCWLDKNNIIFKLENYIKDKLMKFFKALFNQVYS